MAGQEKFDFYVVYHDPLRPQLCVLLIYGASRQKLALNDSIDSLCLI